MEVSWRDYVDLRFKEWERSHKSMIEAERRALELASDSLNQRLDHMNEFRRQIQSERLDYVRKETVAQLLASRQVVVDELIKRIEILENWKANVLGRLLIFGGAVVAIAAIVTAALRLVGH